PRRLHEVLQEPVPRRAPPGPLRPCQHREPPPHRMTGTPGNNTPLRKTHPPPAARSAREINEITLSSRDCGRPSKESSGISSPGGSSTPTTAAHMVPTAKRTTPPADFSSSQSNGVLNKAPGASFLRYLHRADRAGKIRS